MPKDVKKPKNKKAGKKAKAEPNRFVDSTLEFLTIIPPPTAIR